MNILVRVLQKMVAKHPDEAHVVIQETLDEARDEQIDTIARKAHETAEEARVTARILRAEVPPMWVH